MKAEVLSNGQSRTTARRNNTSRLPPRPRLPRGAGLVLLIVVVVAIIAVVLDLTLPSHHHAAPTAAPTPSTSPTPQPSSSGSPQQLAAQAWQRGAEAAEEPAAQAYISMVESAENWQKAPHAKSKIGAVELRADLVSTLRSYADASSGLAKEKPYAPDPQALTDFRQSVTLYSESAKLTEAASYTPAGPLRAQVLLSVTRLRHLGDLVYDQANATLKPLLPPAAPTPNLHFDPTPAVPTWAAMPLSAKCVLKPVCPSLAAGPPLEPTATRLVVTPSGSGPSPTPSPATTPSQSLSSWQRGARAVSVPSGPAEARALSGRSAPAAGSIADQLATAQRDIAKLRPPSDATRSQTLQLDLLIHAEAARAAQEADLAPGRQASVLLRRSASTLAGTGDVLWDRAVSARTTGLH